MNSDFFKEELYEKLKKQMDLTKEHQEDAKFWCEQAATIASHFERALVAIEKLTHYNQLHPLQAEELREEINLLLHLGGRDVL